MRKAGEKLPNPISIDENDEFLVDYLLDEKFQKEKLNI
jgi:hypothetical protein